MDDQVVVERQVVIAATQSAVFDFVTDLRNDPKWRTEVDRMELPTPFKLGDTVTEYSTFFGKQVVTPTVLIENDAPRRFRVATPASFPHHLESLRIVEPLAADISKVTYRLVSDLDILRDVLPMLPPAEALAAAYGETVEGYLATLKNLVESADQ